MAKAIQARKPKVIKTEEQLASELKENLAKKELIAKIKNQKEILEVRLHPFISGKEASDQRLNRLTKINDFLKKELDAFKKEQEAAKAKEAAKAEEEAPAASSETPASK
jgi:hypothetical protein